MNNYGGNINNTHVGNVKIFGDLDITEDIQIEKEKFLQYIFFKQWFSLKKYCNEKNISQNFMP